MIDTHVHLASGDLGAYPHVEDPPFVTERYVLTAEGLISAMRDAGVTQATVVQPFGVYGFDNSYHADSAQRFPAEFVGVCGVPATPEGPDLLRYWVAERGMSGARFATLAQGMTLLDDVVIDVVACAAELDVPVCVLTSRKHVRDVAALASRVPGARLVLDHAGISGAPSDADDAIDRLAPLAPIDTVHLKLTTPMLTGGDPSHRIVDFVLERFGPSRLVWGTNFPLTECGGYAANVAASRRALASLGADEQDQVFRATAEALWPALARRA
jgi:L-fuconolactonase